MTLEEFKTVIGPKYQDLPKERLEALYESCVKVFALYFPKWKAEKTKCVDLSKKE